MNEDKNIAVLSKKYEVTNNTRSKEYYEKLEQIKSLLIHNIIDKKQKDPIMIYAGGQAGSGKNALVQRIQQDFPSKDFLILNLDEFRDFHPDIEEIRKNSRYFAEFTNEFAYRIREDILKIAVENKMDIIINESLRNTESIKKVINTKLRPKGYKIGVYGLAVPYLESALSTQERYEAQIKIKSNSKRFTDIRYHDETYEKFRKTIKDLEKIVDVMKICKRGDKAGDPAEIIYDSKTDKMHRYRDAIDALDYSRNKLEESLISGNNIIINRIIKLYKSKKMRNAPEWEKEPLKKIYDYYARIIIKNNQKERAK